MLVQRAYATLRQWRALRAPVELRNAHAARLCYVTTMTRGAGNVLTSKCLRSALVCVDFSKSTELLLTCVFVCNTWSRAQYMHTTTVFSGDEVLQIQDMWSAFTRSSSSVDDAMMRHNAGCAHANITMKDPFDSTHVAETTLFRILWPHRAFIQHNSVLFPDR